jgi:hypothetical protein
LFCFGTERILVSGEASGLLNLFAKGFHLPWYREGQQRWFRSTASINAYQRGGFIDRKSRQKKERPSAHSITKRFFSDRATPSTSKRDCMQWPAENA